jgi:large subunit ribosomal protein L29
MALLKSKDIRAMRPDDIRAKFKELSDELMHERGVAAMGGAPASPGKIRALRTEIARIHTIMRELDVASAMKTKPKPSAPKESKKSEPKKDQKKKSEEKKIETKEETG